MKQFLFLLITLLLMGSVYSLDVQRDEDINLVHPVRIGEAPSANIDCNITVLDPDNIIFIKFLLMTNDISEHNFTIEGANNSKLGTYNYDITCTNGIANKTDSFEYLVTPSGHQVSTSKSLIMFLAVGSIFIIAIILFILALNIEMMGAKLFIYGLSALLIVFDIGLLLNVVSQSVEEFEVFTPIIRGLFVLSTILAISLGAGLVLWLVSFAFKEFYKLRGFSEETE